MAVTIFKIPRQPDRQVIESLQKLATEAAVPGPQLYFVPFDGAGGTYLAFGAVENNTVLKEVLPLNDASLMTIGLAGHAPQQNRLYVTVKRIGKELFDEVHVQFEGQPRLPDAQFAKLVGLAKQILKEVRIEGVLGGFASEEMTKYYEAREATLSRLENMNRELLYGIHERQRQVDEQFQKKSQASEASLAEERAALQKVFEEKADVLRQKEEVIQKRGVSGHFKTSR
jgi:hypothetical protein